MRSVLDKRLVFVTGKGGVGKTTVALALGMAAVRRGKRTLVCEVAEQSRMSEAFAREGAGPTETELSPGLWAVTVDPDHALEEFVSRQVGGPLARALLHSSAFGMLVAVAPGARELITVAKVWELAQLDRWDPRHKSYDLVVVDAPATGHAVGLLRTPRTYADIARVGPVRHRARRVEEMLADPARTGYVGVALPEELPVGETLELDAALREALGFGLDAVVLNGLYPERFRREEVERLRALAERDGRRPERAAVLRAALLEHERARRQRAHARRLRRALQAPLLPLPFVFAPELGLDDYARLARELDRRL